MRHDLSTFHKVHRLKYETKKLLGLIGYYRTMIANYKKISKPLTYVLRKDTQLNKKNKEYVYAFNIIKRSPATDPFWNY